MRTHHSGIGTHSLIKAWVPANEKQSPSHSWGSGHHRMSEDICSLLLWRCSARTMRSSTVDGWRKGKTGSSVLPSAMTYWFSRWSSSTNGKIIFFILFWPRTSSQPVFLGQGQAPMVVHFPCWTFLPLSLPVFLLTPSHTPVPYTTLVVMLT